MQFRDLPKQYEMLKPQIDEAMIKVATSAHFICGEQVKELEKTLAEYVGVKHCISCANGTDAITIAMRAWGVGKGDAVFVPLSFPPRSFLFSTTEESACCLEERRDGADFLHPARNCRIRSPIILYKSDFLII